MMPLLLLYACCVKFVNRVHNPTEEESARPRIPGFMYIKIPNFIHKCMLQFFFPFFIDSLLVFIQLACHSFFISLNNFFKEILPFLGIRLVRSRFRILSPRSGTVAETPTLSVNTELRTLFFSSVLKRCRGGDVLENYLDKVVLGLKIETARLGS